MTAMPSSSSSAKILSSPEWVQNEVTCAKRIGKPFFPLLLSGSPWLSIEFDSICGCNEQTTSAGKILRTAFTRDAAWRARRISSAGNLNQTRTRSKPRKRSAQIQIQNQAMVVDHRNDCRHDRDWDRAVVERNISACVDFHADRNSFSCASSFIHRVFNTDAKANTDSHTFLFVDSRWMGKACR